MKTTPPQLPSSEDRFVLFRRYGLLLWKRKWIILIVTVTAAVAGYFYTKQQPLIYQATAKIIISLNAPQVLPDVKQVTPLGSGNYWDSREYYSTQYAIIQGKEVAKLVVKKLAEDPKDRNLARDRNFSGTDPGTLLPKEARDLTQDAEFLGIDPNTLSKEDALEMAAALITAGLTIEPIPESLIVLVHFEDTDPKRAQEIVNAVTYAYMNRNLTLGQETAKKAADDLKKQIEGKDSQQGNPTKGLEESLQDSEEKLLQFRKDNVLISPRGEGGTSISDQTLFALKTELLEAQKERRELAARREQIKQLKRTGDLLSIAADAILQSELIAQLKQDYIVAQRDLLDLKTKYLEKHPSVIAQQEKVTWLKENLDREIKNILESIETEYKTVAAKEAEIERELEKAKKEALDIAEKELTYQQLKRKAEDDERLFDQVQQRYGEINFSKSLIGNNVELLEKASAPGGPFKPDLRQNLLIAFLVGLFGGILLALGIEFVDTTLKTEQDAEQFFGTPFLGIIPSLKKDALEEGESADLYIHRHPHSPLAESCRSIRTNLLFASHNKGGLRTLLITSASPKEGKTTTSLNIAVTMANSGSRTLLVDTDMRRPRIHKTFGWANDRGLTTAILNEAELDNVIRKTEIPGLFVLPCGPIPPNPSELIGGPRFQELTKLLTDRFDRVIFDSPPVIAVTDAIVLSTQVDGVVIVASAGKTTRDLALQTSLRLRAVNAPSLGVVMNAVDLESKSYSYAYYYSRYGYYGTDETQEVKKKEQTSK